MVGLEGGRITPADITASAKEVFSRMCEVEGMQFRLFGLLGVRMLREDALRSERTNQGGMMQAEALARSWTSPVQHLLLLTLITAAACSVPDQPPELVNVEGLSIPFEAQAQSERIWEEVSLRPLHEITSGPDVQLYVPNAIEVDEWQNVYVMDYGDMLVKQFDPNGEFVRSYGNGIGEGPGESTGMVDVGLTENGDVFVLDMNARRMAFFSSETGSFKHHWNLDAGVLRYAVTPSGRGYMLITSFFAELPFATRRGKDTHTFGDIWDFGDVGSLLFASGHIHAYDEHLVYAPSRFPIIMQFDSTGAVVYARATLDVGHVETPSYETSKFAGGFGGRVTGQRIHGKVVVRGDTMYVPGEGTMADTTGFADLYDAATGDYLSSIRFPFGPSVLDNDRVWERRDTTVAVYAIER